MLRNIYLEIEYDGTNFFGWQIQNKVQNSKLKAQSLRTVQGEVEKAIEKLFNKRIRIVYSGRTDRGVHAKAQVINFKVETRLLPESIRKALNSFLPEDIYIKKIKFASLDFHSRFRVKLKTYRYLILNKKERDIFLRNYTWWVPQKLDMDLMRKASYLLIGKKDFSLFSKQASKYKSCLRTVKNITINKRGSLLIIDISAEGFLRGMVRNIVGFLTKVTLDNLSLREVKDFLKKGKRAPYIKPAPPQGLYLYKVFY